MRKEVPFGVTRIDDVIWGKYAQNPLKVGVNKQFQANANIWKSLYLQNCKSDQAEISR